MPDPSPGPLSALHGDTWESPWWAVAIGPPRGSSETVAGYTQRLSAVDLAAWSIRAEARSRPLPDTAAPMFTWTVEGGGVELGTADVVLPKRVPDRPTPLELTLPALRLRLRVPDWEGKPSSWGGFLEVQLSSDATSNPEQRRSIQRRRGFEIVADAVG